MESSSDNQSFRVRVPAKVNLALCVAPLGEDGYHQLGTVFHAIGLHDDVIACSAPDGVTELVVTGEGAEDVPTDGTNLAWRAARLLAETHGHPGLGVRLSIRKQIPVAGGMAGGSADAAGALLACSMLWDLDTGPDDLHELAARLGSDVPFALLGANAIGRGRGDELVPLLGRGTYHWVLALAHGGLSTPEVYRRFDELGGEHSTEIPDQVMNALASGDPAALAGALRNDLQAAAIDLRPELAETLEFGRAHGALGGIVSGSGPTCAFLAASESDAMDLASALNRLPQVRGTRRAVGPVPGAKPIS